MLSIPALVVTVKQLCCAGSHVERYYRWDKPKGSKISEWAFTRAVAIPKPRLFRILDRLQEGWRVELTLDLEPNTDHP